MVPPRADSARVDAAADAGTDCRGSAAAAAVSTASLLLLLAWAHAGHLLFEPRHQWGAFASGLGLLAAVLVWQQRGPRFAARWWLCLWGAFECAQVFVCQGLQAWQPVDAPFGSCSAYTGLPLFGWGLGLLAVVAGLLARGNNDGH